MQTYNEKQIIEFLKGKLIETENCGEAAMQYVLAHGTPEGLEVLGRQVDKNVNSLKMTIAFLEGELAEEPVSEPKDVLPSDEGIIDKQRREAREAILEYYNDDKGLVASAIQRMHERAEREQKESARFENTRKMAFLLCRDLLTELWNLEKNGIHQFDNQAEYTSMITAEPSAEAWSIILSDGNNLCIYSSPTQPCRVTWTHGRDVLRESVLMTVDGECASDPKIIEGFMDVAFDFIESFIIQYSIR